MVALGDGLAFTVEVVSREQMNVLQSFDLSYDEGRMNAVVTYSFSAVSTGYTIVVLLNNKPIDQFFFLPDSLDYSSILLYPLLHRLTPSTEPSNAQAAQRVRDIPSLESASFVLTMPLGLLLSPEDVSAHSAFASALLLPPSAFAISSRTANSLLVTPITPVAGEYLVNLFVHNVLFRAEVRLVVHASSLASQLLFWGDGLVGGRTTDTLLVCAKKTDLFGNRLFSFPARVTHSNMDDLALTAESKTTSASVPVFKTPFGDFVQFAFRHTLLPEKAFRDKLGLQLTDAGTPCTPPLPLEGTVVRSASLSLPHSVVAVESQVHVGDEVLLSLSPRDLYGNLIAPSIVCPFINITATNQQTGLVVMSTLGPYTRGTNCSNVQPYLLSANDEACVFLFSFIHSGEFQIVVTAASAVGSIPFPDSVGSSGSNGSNGSNGSSDSVAMPNSAGEWSGSIVVRPGAFDPRRSRIEVDGSEKARLITNDAFTDEMAARMHALGVELTNDVVVRNAHTMVVSGVQFILHCSLVDISFAAVDGVLDGSCSATPSRPAAASRWSSRTTAWRCCPTTSRSSSTRTAPPTFCCSSPTRANTRSTCAATTARWWA